MRFMLTTLLMMLALSGAAALADTAQEVEYQAQQPWKETISAFGREIVIDVTPEMESEGALGIYRAETISAREQTGEAARREQPKKRRGYANRRKPEEVYAAEEIDRAYRAYGSAVTAGEALDLVEAFLEPLRAQAGAAAISLDTMTVQSPIYIYNKNTGEWGEQLYPEQTGEYSFACSFRLDGLEIVSQGAWRDVRDWDFSLPEPELPWWSAALWVGENGTYSLMYLEAPGAVKKTAEVTDLAPLEATKESLRSLAREGLLRGVERLRLAYAAFDTGEEGVYELRPVWIARVEIYYDETKDAQRYGEALYDSVFTDARTGEIIQLRWADGAQPVSAGE